MAGTPLTDLNRPLGRDRTAKGSKPWGRWLAMAACGCAGLVLASLLLFIAIKRNPDGGEPVATAMIEKRAAPAASADAQPAAPSEPRSQSTARQLENDSGVVVVRQGAEAPGSIVITIPDSNAPAKLAPAPDSRLVERTRFGMLPRIGPGGETPAQVYARPVGPSPVSKPAGRIALMVGGLGISQASTSDAITRLPGPVSFAFAPYGADLERTVQRARGSGHEVFLQVPMEPFDYPDNDPGPHTLLAGQNAGENADKLGWVLGRFTGYVGIVNFLGGRLTADEAALTTLLREISGRGLMVIDDGSSPRSLLAASAARAQIPALKVDRVIDSVPRADAIDKELERLEAMARERGIAVAAASALPVSIDRIMRWSAGLEAKGIVLVPVSAARGFRNPSSTGSLR